jgi:hypothetical protein
MQRKHPKSIRMSKRLLQIETMLKFYVNTDISDEYRNVLLFPLKFKFIYLFIFDFVEFFKKIIIVPFTLS